MESARTIISKDEEPSQTQNFESLGVTDKVVRLLLNTTDPSGMGNDSVK